MKLPKNTTLFDPVPPVPRYWVMINKEVKPGTKVTVDRFWDETEINVYPTLENVAQFKCEKHAREFCKINKLVVT